MGTILAATGDGLHAAELAQRRRARPLRVGFVIVPAAILLRYYRDSVFMHNSTFPHKGIVTRPLHRTAKNGRPAL
jgi:hypothetical protein